MNTSCTFFYLPKTLHMSYY